MSNDFIGNVVGMFTRAVALVLALLLMATVAFAVAESVILFARQLGNPPQWILELDEFRSLFGFFLVALIGLQLLEAVRGLLEEGHMRPELLLLAGVVVIVQRIVSADLANQPYVLLGNAAVILALCGGYFLLRRTAGGAGRSGPGGSRQRKWEGET